MLEDHLYDCDRVKKLLMDNLVKARERMKKFADLRRTERSFEVGDKVLLKLQPYRRSTARGAMPHKLSPKFFGPYIIMEEIGAVAYRLQLPPDARKHNVFHVSQLKKFEGKELRVQYDPPLFWKMKIKAPEIILDRRLITRRNRPVTQVLISR